MTTATNYIKAILIVVTTVTIIFVGSKTTFGTENPFYIVSSGSMTPVLDVNDVIIVQENIPLDKIKVGDIIVFSSPDNHHEVIVHRVAEILTQDPLQIRTKGDANSYSIPGTDMPISKNDYIGKVAYVIPHLGYVERSLSPPVNYVIAVAIAGILIVNISSMQKSKKFSST